MKVLRSKKGIPIPKLYFVTDRKEIGELPKGVPYIFGDADSEEYIVRIMEYEVLYQRALESGYPFNFKRLLIEAGFEDMEDYDWSASGNEIRLSLTSGPMDKNKKDVKEGSLLELKGKFKSFIKDSSVYVDISVIKSLNIMPVWLNSIEEAVATNIQNFAVYDNNMYNKKLEGMYGGVKLKSPDKNLIIIDISSSVPRAVSATCLALAKNLSETFYADILITGSKSTLYEYADLYKLDINTIYEENGMDNDQIFFKELVLVEKQYDTAIVFGDNDVPGYNWHNEFNSGTGEISSADGKALCKWQINKLISFHTTSVDEVAGYADWFTPKETVHIENWMRDISEKAKEENPEGYN